MATTQGDKIETLETLVIKDSPSGIKRWVKDYTATDTFVRGTMLDRNMYEENSWTNNMLFDKNLLAEIASFVVTKVPSSTRCVDLQLVQGSEYYEVYPKDVVPAISKAVLLLCDTIWSGVNEQLYIIVDAGWRPIRATPLFGLIDQLIERKMNFLIDVHHAETDIGDETDPEFTTDFAPQLTAARARHLVFLEDWEYQDEDDEVFKILCPDGAADKDLMDAIHSAHATFFKQFPQIYV